MIFETVGILIGFLGNKFEVAIAPAKHHMSLNWTYKKYVVLIEIFKAIKKW